MAHERRLATLVRLNPLALLHGAGADDPLQGLAPDTVCLLLLLFGRFEGGGGGMLGTYDARVLKIVHEKGASACRIL